MENVDCEIINLLDLSLSEEQLEMRISETQNLKLLISLLKLKKRRVLEGRELKINYHVDKICEVTGEDIQLQCEALKIFFFVTENLEEETVRVIRYLNFQLDKVNRSFDLDLAFKIAQILNGILVICTNQVMKTLFQKNMSLNNLDKFLDIGLKMENSLRVYIISNVLPNYISLLSESHQLLFLSNSFLECRTSKNLDVLCIIVNYVQDLFLLTNSESLLFSYNFWEYLENCITSENSSIQKQAIFLLKKCVQAYHNCNAVKSEIIYLQTDNIFFETSEQVWHNFFILHEASKEKQLHLIWPALTLLNSLKHLHPLWQTCVYKKLLAHTQNTVVYFVASHILNNDVNFLSLNKYLLSAVNKHEHSTDSMHMFKALPKFCNKMDMESFTAFLEDFLKITWTPTAAWCLVSNLFTETLSKPISFQLLESLFQLLKQLPHVYIRNGCISVLLNYFVRDFNWQNTFDESLKLLIMIKGHDNKFFMKTVSENIDKDVLNIILGRIKQKILDENIFEAYVQILKILNYEVRIEAYLSKPHKRFCFEMHSNFTKLFETRNFFLKEKSKLDVDCVEKLVLFVEESTEKDTKAQDIFYNILREPRNYSETMVSLALQLYSSFFSYSGDGRNISLDDLKDYVLEFGKTNDLLCSSFLRYYFTQAMNLDLDFLEHILDNQSDIVIAKMFQLLPLTNYFSDILVVFHKKVLNVLPNLTKSKHFKSIISNYIKCFFSQFTIYNVAKNNSKGIDVIKQAIQFLFSLSEAFPIIDYYLSQSFKDFLRPSSFYFIREIINLPESSLELEFFSEYYVIFIPAICDFLLKGTIIKKDERIEYCVCQEIYEKLGDEKENPNFIKMITRMSALESMVRIISFEPLNNNFCDPLLTKYKMYFNKRYFPDSQIHLQKLRIVQALLTIHPFIHNTDTVIELIMESFCTELHQTCVRQLMQWLLFCLVKKDDQYFNLIKTKIDTTNKAQPSSIVAFIVVLFLLTISREEPFWYLAMEALIPWSMGAHFKLRVYSQAAIKQLLEKAKERQYKNFMDKYSDLERSVVSVIEASGSAFHETLKSDELFFSVFKPEEDFSLQTIYVDIPKLNGVTRTEWENVLRHNFRCRDEINVKNKSKSFSNAVSIYIEKKATNKETIGRELENTQNIQRKITPCETGADQENKKVSDFILIASLIDKPTNLGGLSRTCEVFGVKEVVLNDIKVVKDKEFKSLSMSSDNWINASEVKRNELKQFICDLRQQGYTVVGAEQTSDSVCLHKYKFNKKTALVLGNEKEGIPADIIPNLDVCVEIPQFGMVRSLNVHVAGATFIWEYAKQNLL